MRGARARAGDHGGGKAGRRTERHEQARPRTKAGNAIAIFWIFLATALRERGGEVGPTAACRALPSDKGAKTNCK